MATVEHPIGTGRPGADRRAWLGLAVLSLPTLLVSLDLFVVLLAVPRLGVALGASSTDQLWILDVYGSWWGSIFLLGVPVMALLLAVGPPALAYPISPPTPLPERLRQRRRCPQKQQRSFWLWPAALSPVGSTP